MPCNKKKRKRMNQTGVFSFVVVFSILAIILLILFALVIPVLINYNSKMWPQAEKLMLDANESLQDIQNPAVKALAVNHLSSAYETIPTQNDVLEVFFQYSWVIIILVIGITWFIYARQTVEAGGLA